MIYWIGFIVCTSIIVYSGSRLSKYGDIIAEKSGLGRTWIGLVLMASVTSLPELITGISSVTYAGVPDIALGDVLGACVFNMFIFALLDALTPATPLSTKAHEGNVLSAGFGILLISTIAASLYVSDIILPLGWIGPYTLVVIVVYLIAMRVTFSYEKRRISAFVKEVVVELKYKDITMKTAIVKYSINALIVILAAVSLPKIGEGLAETTGLGKTFVGNVFIAFTTTLPEVVVSVSAVRLDAVNLAIGNLFGSNIFNIFILAIDDIFFVKGHILSYVDKSHIISALSAIAMTTVAIIGLTFRSSKKPFLLAWDSIVIALLFILNLMFLYMLR